MALNDSPHKTLDIYVSRSEWVTTYCGYAPTNGSSYAELVVLVNLLLKGLS